MEVPTSGTERQIHVVTIQVERTEEAVTRGNSQESNNLGRSNQGSQRETKKEQEPEEEERSLSQVGRTWAALRVTFVTWVS